MHAKGKDRHKARILALQALFELDMTQHTPQQVIAERLDGDKLGPKGTAFFQDLLNGALAHREELDRYIQELAPERPVSQLAAIDRNILRLAIWEISSAKMHTPYRVAINEAIELAKTFGSKSTPRFVNGVLGGMVNKHPESVVTLLDIAKGEKRSSARNT